MVSGRTVVMATVAAFAALAAGRAEGAAMGISIEAVPVASAVRSDVVAKWIEPGDTKWRAGKPAFTVADKAKQFEAKGWLAVTDKALLLTFEISDRLHIPAPDSFQLYAADGIEIGIDVRGDGSGKLPKEAEGVMGPDDAKFVVAFGPDGVVGRCFQADRDENTGLLPAAWVSGARNEKKGLTTYELTLPWERFETVPGLYPTFGLAVQFNDLDEKTGERSILNWGEGTFGTMKPGLFRTVAVGTSPAPFTASVVDHDVIWSELESGEVVVAVTGKGSYRVEATLGTEKKDVSIDGSGELQRFSVTLTPGATDSRAVPFSVRLLDGGGAVLQERTGELSIVDATLRALYSAVDAALDTASHPLFRRHLLSVKAIVTDEWARATLYRETGERGDARRTFQYVQNVLAGFEDNAGTWETYLSGKRDLYMSYVSRLDRTVQFYVLSLPKSWEPDRKYPLFVELHGAGNENFMSDLSARLGPVGQALDLRGYEDRGTYVQREGNGYYIMPTGRGNLGYRGPGETDVWEAYDDVHRLFKIDEDRRYLFGFSMGGGGTWSLGTRTPDRWAAIMIMAGGMWRERRGLDLGRNLSRLPVFIWCGEDDNLFPNVALFTEQIRKFGGTPVVKTAPGISHNYTRDIQKECAQWLQKHTRKRPDEFTFAADTDEHRGVWGVTMVRDLSVSGLPWFTCTVKGGEVSIRSEGTPGLTVVLGESGLGLSGEANVVWNGAEAYRGPVKTVTLGEVPQERRRH